MDGSEQKRDKIHNNIVIIVILRYLKVFSETVVKELFQSLGSISVALAFGLIITFVAPGFVRNLAETIFSVIGLQHPSAASSGASQPPPLSPQMQQPKPPPQTSDTAVHLANFEERIARLEARQDVIDKSLQDNPERALSIPLLRRDLENLKSTTAQQVQDTRAQADRLYDVVKWILGATVFGILSLALAGMVSRLFEEKSKGA